MHPQPLMREVGCVGHWLPSQLQRHPLFCVLQQQAALALGKALQDLIVVEARSGASSELVGSKPSLVLPLVRGHTGGSASIW